MKRIVSFFTLNKVPASGLSPVIYIYNITDDILEIDGASMAEKGSSSYIFYVYNFSGYNSYKDYFIVTDGGSDTLDDRYQPAVNESAGADEISDTLDDSDASIG